MSLLFMSIKCMCSVTDDTNVSTLEVAGCLSRWSDTMLSICGGSNQGLRVVRGFAMIGTLISRECESCPGVYGVVYERW